MWKLNILTTLQHYIKRSRQQLVSSSIGNSSACTSTSTSASTSMSTRTMIARLLWQLHRTTDVRNYFWFIWCLVSNGVIHIVYFRCVTWKTAATTSPSTTQSKQSYRCLVSREQHKGRCRWWHLCWLGGFHRLAFNNKTAYLQNLYSHRKPATIVSYYYS